ncbi:Uncharacterised protein [Yersinia enterocolitica]|nr:Uncharacterised protein [Yersinia enterocolitica]CQR11483.1 Uncharacterised protein [Yersinia enterocolitica]
MRTLQQVDHILPQSLGWGITKQLGETLININGLLTLFAVRGDKHGAVTAVG